MRAFLWYSSLIVAPCTGLALGSGWLDLPTAGMAWFVAAVVAGVVSTPVPWATA